MALTQVIGRGLGTQTTLAGSNTLVLDTDGIMTRPLQPAFDVYKSSSQDNLATGTSHTITWQSEYFDNNGDFSSNTFTAPVTGRYLLGTRLKTGTIDSGATYYYIMLTTSNRNYYNIMSTDRYSGDPTYYHFQISELAEMDAGDTAHVTFVQVGGTAQTDIGADENSSFWGHLVC